MGLDDKIVRMVSFNQTKKLLVDLAIHFSEKTELLSVPPGTSIWLVENFNEEGHLLETIRIELVHFFGTYVGYNSDLDLLVMWKV